VIGEIGSDSSRCSRAGCRSDAVWRVNWRNPRIHDASRVKVWASCEEHREYFEGYLTSRGMPVEITPLGVAVERLEA
jgi:hypothetical protein